MHLFFFTCLPPTQVQSHNLKHTHTRTHQYWIALIHRATALPGSLCFQHSHTQYVLYAQRQCQTVNALCMFDTENSAITHTLQTDLSQEM